MKIYVGNLSRDVTKDELQRAFEARGQVASTIIITGMFTGQSRGFGFVEMPKEEEARAVMKELKAWS